MHYTISSAKIKPQNLRANLFYLSLRLMVLCSVCSVLVHLV